MSDDECPKLDDCPIFNEFKTDASKRIWTRKYCTGDFEECERFQRAERGEDVPMSLLPSGERVDHLAAE